MNKKNLLKLAAYLKKRKLNARFRMLVFSDNMSFAGLDQTVCGTVGCAVGHGPYAGIRKFKNETWREYSNRVFGLDSEEWDWCFCGGWVYVDNTPKGAAKRIEYLLNHGVPETAKEQLYLQEPLCY